MTFNRPRVARKDKNQSTVLRELGQMLGGWQKIEGQPAWQGFCQGVPVTVIDTAQVGGLIVDTICIVDGIPVFVEIKDAGKREELTAGERMFSELAPAAFRVIETSDEYYQVICELVTL